MGKHLTDSLGLELPQKQQYVVGRSVHYFMGIAPGALYAICRHRMIKYGFLRGPLYGLGLFLVFDEIIPPALGYASGPFAYPWQAHARGFFAHIILGSATELTISLPEKGTEIKIR